MQLNEDLSSNDNTLREKIFAHTDKDFYISGEILWFKLYALSADSLKPVDLSKIAYVEILNAQQKPVLQASVALNNASGNGSFYLPSSISSGNYVFRAYTNWMKNFGPDAFFQKVITIVNALTPVVKTVDNNSAQFDVRFNPEGGNLVPGANNKVGFKVLNKYGYGVNCNGYIVDDNKQKIVSINTLKFGMGSFYFTPQSNRSYKAVIQINNDTIERSLPQVNVAGYAMHVYANAQLLHVAVKANNNFQPTIYIATLHGNTIKTINSQTLNYDGTAVFDIEKSKLPEGITDLIVLNSDKQPVSRRLVFKRPQAEEIAMSTDKDSYDIRSQVTVSLTDTSAANLSMSVFRIDSLQSANNDNILSSLYFSSALEGNIESPQYYFNNNDAETDSAIDNLLLTQCILNFNNYAQNSRPAFNYAPEQEGHIITGKVTDRISGMPGKNIRVYVSAPGLYYQFATAVSDDSGNVFFDVKNYYGSGELIVQTAKEDSAYRVEMSDPYSSQSGTMQAPQLLLNKSDLQQLNQHSLAMQVQNAYSASELNSFNSPPLDTNAFYGKPDRKYFLDNYTRFNTMEEVLREYIANVDVRIKQKNYFLFIFNPYADIFFKNNPLVLIDGVPVFDMNRLMAYDPHKIKKAEVVESKFYLNSFTADGILSCTTYKGDLDGFQFEPGTTELAYDGLQLERKFYAPEYSTNDQIKSRLPDYRNVLCWLPQITVNGRQEITFSTSDVKGKYIAVVQGMEQNGKAIYKTITFEVK